MGVQERRSADVNYIWENELIPVYGDTNAWHDTLHLKKAWKSPTGQLDQYYKVSAAWITREGKRKWHLTFADSNEQKTFSTLKAAKAYAVAIVSLES